MIHSKEETSAENLISIEQSNKDNNKSKPKKKNNPGRPKGSKNKNRENVDLSKQLCLIQNMLKKIQQLIGSDISLIYGVELRKLSPGAGFFDSDVQPVTRDCFLSRMEVIK